MQPQALFRKIPWGGEWQPTPVFVPGEAHGQRSLAGLSPYGDMDTGIGHNQQLKQQHRCVTAFHAVPGVLKARTPEWAPFPSPVLSQNSPSSFPKMAEQKDVCSSSPARTPKLQLVAEQLSTREGWIPPKKDTLLPRAKEKPQQDGRRGKCAFRIKPHPATDARKAQTNLVCTRTQRPYREQARLCLSISCGGPGQQWPAAGARALGAVDLGVHEPSWRRSPLTPPQSCQKPEDWKQTLGGHRQNLVHQDPGERSSDPTRD